jgi:LysR family transcriptional regulator, nitrogen assimilation regulatory protein
MDLRQLRYFALVADLRSIARASAHLGIAAPAISRSVSALEEELGTALFARDGRGMSLTPAGLILHGRAAQLLRDAELARQEVMAEGRHLAGEVVIGATPSVIAMAGAALVERCAEALPRVRPRFLEGYSVYLHNWALTGVVDIALSNGLPPNAPRLCSQRLAVERLFAISAPGALVGGPEGVTLAALTDAPLLLPSARNPVRGPIDSATATLGATNVRVAEIDSVTLLKDLARAGRGTAILPFGAVKNEVKAGLLAAWPIIGPEIQCDLNLVHLVDRPPTRVAAAVVRLLGETLRDVLTGGEPHGFVEVTGLPRERHGPARRAQLP